MGKLTLEQFKLKYKNCLRKSNDALKIDESGNKLEAINLYYDIINDIDILVCSEVLDNNDDYKKMLNNLQKLRDSICESIERLRSSNTLSGKYSGANKIYSLSSGCQFCKSNTNGDFNNPSEPGSLEIYKLGTDDSTDGFIAIGSWTGLLVYNVTPILVTKEGVLVYTDPTKPEEQIAIILPYNISNEEFQRLISVLSNLSFIFCDFETKKLSTGEIVSEKLDKISQSISHGLVTGATKLGEYVEWGSDELCNKIEGSSKEHPVDPRVKTGLEYARKGSHGLVQVSGKALSLLYQGTQYVASKAAPHLKSAITKAVPEEWTKSSETGEVSKLDQFGYIAGASLKGIGQLFESLQQSAIIFGRSFTRGSSHIVRHRYGNEYGTATENALYSAGNLGLTAYAAGTFTKKGLLKTTATVTAIELTNPGDTNKESSKDTKKDEQKVVNNDSVSKIPRNSN